MPKDPLTFTENEMREYGYQIIDILIDHFTNLNHKKPIALGTRREMDELLEESIPEHGEDPRKVLKHIVDDILEKNDLFTHPKSYAFVPSPSNFISVMADTLATGYNVFAGGRNASPAASSLVVAITL